MTNQTGAAAAARETARTQAGQFGTQPLAEAELKLAPDTHFSHEELMSRHYAADKENKARLDRAFPGLRWAADDFDGPQIYGPASVQDNAVEAPYWAAYRRGEGGYRPGSFSEHLMDLYEAETTTEEDRAAMGQWWPDMAAELDKGR